MACFTSPKARIFVGAVAALVLFSAPTRADEPTPAMIDMAAKILADTNLRQSVDVVVPGMFVELERSIGAMHPEMRQVLHETVVELMPGYAGGEEAVLNDVTHTLASQMSEAELKAALAFFESDAGKRYVAAQPAMINQLTKSVTAWREAMSKDIVPRLRDAMKKKGYDF
jgi:uncharacterized protein